MSTLPGIDRAHVVLIESRLDSIERNLMDSRVPRGQRSEIVRAVERQIYDLLEAHDGKVTRAVVLQILGSLDPPEAYRDGEPRPLPVRAAQFAQPAAPTSSGTDAFQPAPPTYIGVAPQACTSPHCVQRTTSSFAFAALVLAVLSIPAVIVVPIGTLVAFAGAVCGVIACIQISKSGGRLSGRWMAVFSFVTFAIHVCVICWVLASI